METDLISIGGRWFVYDEEGHRMIETDSEGLVLPCACGHREDAGTHGQSMCEIDDGEEDA